MIFKNKECREKLEQKNIDIRKKAQEELELSVIESLNPLSPWDCWSITKQSNKHNVIGSSSQS